jgi:tRNA G18 (ribose-2'-O)-methylase SpoU
MRSTHNVGSLLRTADGLGVDEVYLSGYTPYPMKIDDERLPHIARKLDAQIHKTALGAETSVHWEHVETLEKAITNLRNDGYTIVALEQAAHSITLNNYIRDNRNIAVVLGSEREGFSKDELTLVDEIIEIPMNGKKESFNVVQAAAIALYTLINFS